MNVLSLFDGIGTGMLALKNAGIRIEKYYASEIERKPIETALKNHSNIIELGDVNGVEVERLGKIDLIIGGSPCQGFSRNGKHLNFDDPRSGLFLRYVEILEEIKRTNPEVKFMLENVRMKREWQDIITDFLEVEPVQIDSRIHTAQARERTYWTNIAEIQQPAHEECTIRSIAEKRNTGKYIKQNGVWFDPAISEKERELVELREGEIRVKQATKIGYIVAEEGDGINLQFPTSKTRRGRVIKGKLPTLDCSCNVCYLLDGTIHKITVREAERAQNLPDGYTEGMTDSEARAAIGNGWNEKTVRHIFEYLKAEPYIDDAAAGAAASAAQLTIAGATAKKFWEKEGRLLEYGA